MAWKKIDDYNSGDTGYPEQPYSAFLAQGLTQTIVPVGSPKEAHRTGASRRHGIEAPRVSSEG